MVSHNLTVLEGHWSSASEYIKYLICHVTSKNHVIVGSNNFMSGSSSWYITNLVAIYIVVEMLLSLSRNQARLTTGASQSEYMVVIGTVVVKI